jgi:hypothetical protein
MRRLNLSKVSFELSKLALLAGFLQTQTTWALPCLSQATQILQRSLQTQAQKKQQLLQLSAFIAGGAAVTFESDGSIVETVRYPTPDRDYKWPYLDIANPLTITRGTALIDDINNAHNIFQDEVFFETKKHGFFPREQWQSDKFRPTNIGSLWTQVAGGWDTQIVPVEGETPLMGMRTYYPNAPHAPNLYQFTTVDYSTWNLGYVKVTHYAWVLEQPKYSQQVDPAYFGAEPTIPAPGAAAAILGAAAYTLLKRVR